MCLIEKIISKKFPISDINEQLEWDPEVTNLELENYENEQAESLYKQVVDFKTESPQNKHKNIGENYNFGTENGTEYADEVENGTEIGKNR